MAEKKTKIQLPGKLGKHPVKIDRRTINYASFVNHDTLNETPKEYSWSKKKKSRWGAMKNIKIDDCTCAAAGHMIQSWTMNISKPQIISDNHILKAYSDISGYNIKTGENDSGATALDFLKYWRKNGIGGHKILAFASVDHKEAKHLMQAIYLFGGAFGGLQLPKSIIGQDIWDVPETGLKGIGKIGSYGGHAVCLLDYDEKGLTAISWGRKKKMTWAFWHAYSEEAYIAISHSFIKSKKTPSGFDISTLEKELMKATGQKAKLSKQLQSNISNIKGGKANIKKSNK